MGGIVIKCVAGAVIGAYVGKKLFVGIKKIRDVRDWNDYEFCSFTNCYAYALDMLNNPLTGKRFNVGGLQPSVLKKIHDKEDVEDNYDYFKTHRSKEDVVLALYDDMDVAKIKLQPYKDGFDKEFLKIMEEKMEKKEIEFKYYNGSLIGYKVALFLRSDMTDWHWYRRNEKDKSWSHKQGKSQIATGIGKIPIGKDDKKPSWTSLKDDNIKEAAKLVGYDLFVGYFRVIHPPNWSKKTIKEN